MLKRSHHGTYYRMHLKRLLRYLNELADLRPSDTVDQMRVMIPVLEGKRLKCVHVTG